MRHEIPRVYFSACVFYRTVRLAKVKHDVSIADLRPHEVLPPHNTSRDGGQTCDGTGVKLS